MFYAQNWFFWLFVALYAFHLIVEIVLDSLNLRELKKNREKIPDPFKDSFSQEDYQKSIDYTRTKMRFGWTKAGFDVFFLWFLILSGGFFVLDQWLGRLIPSGTLWHQIAYPLFIGAILYVLHLPFGIYHQFVLEEQFGFNKTTSSTFVLDQIKTIALSLVLGGPLLALIFSTVSWLGYYWWIGGWAVVLGFQIFTAAIFPILLAPLFYKFTPIEEGDLKNQIFYLAEKVNFKMSGVFIIDGSRRSAHSNAFFAGIGKTRRIVLFDTLVASLTNPEILSVLAHEMGHNVKKHIQKGLALSASTALLGFFLLSLCLKWQPFFSTFGVPETSLHIGFVLFGLLSSVFTFPFTPLFKWISRRNEYASDAFSVEVTGDKESMKGSLLKLSKENLANLTPHPWYSFFHYSHPTTAERVRAIESIAG